MNSINTLSENKLIKQLLDNVYDAFFEKYIEDSNVKDFLDNTDTLKEVLRDMFAKTLGQNNETIIQIYTKMIKENFKETMPYNMHADFFEQLSKELIIYSVENSIDISIIKKIYLYRDTVINATSKGFLFEVIDSDLPLIESQLRESMALVHVNDHLRWIKKMISDIKTGCLKTSIELSPNRCEFNIWLNSLDKNKYLNNQDIEELKKIHKKIHSIGKNIYNSIQKENFTQALIGYLVLAKLSLHMVNSLNIKITEKELVIKAETDPLTGLKNRQTMFPILKKMLELHSMASQSFTVALLDIDYFKRINDQYGHQVGDEALKHIARIITKQIRESDIIFRYGGEEFLIIFSYNSLTGGIFLSEKIRVAIEQDPFQYADINLPITASIGLAEYIPAEHKDYKSLIADADKQLYLAKDSGRNRISFVADKRRMQNLTNIDNVAKLPNREILLQDISLLQEKAMLILLHINQIKTLNDLYSPDTIEIIISKKVAQLNSVLTKGEYTLYKLNLQEFAIVIKEEMLFDKYLSILEYSILLDDEDVCDNENSHIVADFTAGISYGVNNIFHMADLALQEALLENKQYEIYQHSKDTKSIQEKIFKQLKIYKDALHDDRIIPYFQPIVSTIDNKILKYEALARIITEDGEIISPHYFLQSAKDDKTFEYFTRQMMQKVFNIFAKNDINISINLTYENLKSESMINYIKNRLDKYGGDGITFEIVESEDIKDYTIVEDFILMVKEYKCEVSIDDFGSGYSNFTNLIKFNIDYIKLDGTLIEKLPLDENVKYMVKSLVSFAKDTKIKTIGEFVSSKELADLVKELQIDYSQGYYFSEPKNAEDSGFNV